MERRGRRDFLRGLATAAAGAAVIALSPGSTSAKEDNLDLKKTAAGPSPDINPQDNDIKELSLRRPRVGTAEMPFREETEPFTDPELIVLSPDADIFEAVSQLREGDVKVDHVFPQENTIITRNIGDPSRFSEVLAGARIFNDSLDPEQIGDNTSLRFLGKTWNDFLYYTDNWKTGQPPLSEEPSQFPPQSEKESYIRDVVIPRPSPLVSSSQEQGSIPESEPFGRIVLAMGDIAVTSAIIECNGENSLGSWTEEEKSLVYARHLAAWEYFMRVEERAKLTIWHRIKTTQIPIEPIRIKVGDWPIWLREVMISENFIPQSASDSDVWLALEGFNRGWAQTCQAYQSVTMFAVRNTVENPCWEGGCAFAPFNGPFEVTPLYPLGESVKKASTDAHEVGHDNGAGDQYQKEACDGSRYGYAWIPNHNGPGSGTGPPTSGCTTNEKNIMGSYYNDVFWQLQITEDTRGQIFGLSSDGQELDYAKPNTTVVAGGRNIVKKGDSYFFEAEVSQSPLQKENPSLPDVNPNRILGVNCLIGGGVISAQPADGRFDSTRETIICQVPADRLGELDIGLEVFLRLGLNERLYNIGRVDVVQEIIFIPSLFR